MNVTDLLQRYDSGKRDFAWADLREANLADAILVEINLSGANLSGAVLTRADLSRANLLRANLTGADLTGANLTGANLRKATLTDARLETAILDNTTLTGTIAPDGNPLLTAQPSGAEPEPIALAATGVEVAIALPPPLPQTWQAVRSRLPWTALAFSTVGYALFGLLLVANQSSFFGWWAIWAIALLGVNESLTWFVPLLPAIVVIGATGISVWALAVASTVTVALFLCLKGVMGFKLGTALKDSVWVGSLSIILLQIASWLFTQGNDYGVGFIIVAFKTYHLALLLLAAIGCSAFGAIAGLQMQQQGISLRYSHGVVAIGATLGLLCGRLAGFTLTP